MRETLWKLPDHAFVKETVFRLAKEDPDVRVFSPGRSALGRELLLLSIGKEENAVLLVGGTHAQEWITVSLLLKFAASVSGDRRLKERLAEEGKGVMILPSLNPDGVEIALHGSRRSLSKAGQRALRRFSGEALAGERQRGRSEPQL